MFAIGSYFVVIMYMMGTIFAVSWVEIPPKKQKQFFNHILKEHNEYRQIHGSKPLIFDGLCSTLAFELLNKMLLYPFSTNNLNICGVNEYTTDDIGVSELNATLAKKIVAFWYETGANYNYLAEPTNNEADAFTQIVWKESSLFGLQMALTEEGKLFIAATYFFKGNVKGKYLDNVKKPEMPKVKKFFGNLFKGLN